MYLLLVAGLIVLNGLFSMSELALVSARPNRLAQRAARGDKSASAALELSRNPTRFLSTVQIGITTCGILSGIFGEAVLSDPLAGELQRLGMNETQSVIIARIVVVAIVTYLSIIFGELVPKRIGQLNPEGIARVVARPMRALSFVSRPLVWLLSFTTNAILKLAGVRNENAPITQEDIFDVLQQGSRSGAIENDEQAMIRNVIRLDDRLLGSLMTHRSDVVTLDRLLPPEENIRRIREYEYTIYPVCDGGPEHLLGTLRAKDALYALMRGGQKIDWPEVTPGIYVPETLGGLDLLRQFKNGTVTLALVVDEYGEWSGIVTLKDLLEVLAGEAVQNSEEEAVKVDDATWLFRGSLPAETMREYLGLDSLPGEGFNTTGGMIMSNLRRIPAPGESMDWKGWRFEVRSMDGNRIHEVVARKLEGRREEARLANAVLP